MMAETTIHSDLAIPPGEYLEEILAELGMTKDELARRMGRPATKLSAIFKGGKAITPETALQLEKVVNVPAHIWTGLEAEYRLTLARKEEQQREARETELIALYPCHDLQKVGEIAKCSKAPDKVRELQAFFGVSSLRSVSMLQRYQAVFRVGRSARGERSPEAVVAWLRMGERQARRVQCAPFSEERLRALLTVLRGMTLQSPEVFWEPLQAGMSECGVALVICPHFTGTLAHGATFWLARDKAVLMITIRGKWVDIFWFSLLHEIGHLLLHGRQMVILEEGDDDPMEREADTFAADILIPREDFERFRQRNQFYPKDIKAFAARSGIHPGIVVGRLQHENLIQPRWGNGLRDRFTWVAQPTHDSDST